MKDYSNLFVALSLQQCTKNDYGNKQKVKAHNAASLCLQMNILVEQAVLTLNKIVRESGDSTICFSAKMLLQREKE